MLGCSMRYYSPTSLDGNIHPVGNDGVPYSSVFLGACVKIGKIWGCLGLERMQESEVWLLESDRLGFHSDNCVTLGKLQVLPFLSPVS